MGWFFSRYYFQLNSEVILCRLIIIVAPFCTTIYYLASGSTKYLYKNRSAYEEDNVNAPSLQLPILPPECFPRYSLVQDESTWGLKNAPWFCPGIQPGTFRLAARPHAYWSIKQQIDTNLTNLKLCRFISKILFWKILKKTLNFCCFVASKICSWYILFKDFGGSIFLTMLSLTYIIDKFRSIQPCVKVLFENVYSSQEIWFCHSTNLYCFIILLGHYVSLK